ncbi:2-hydroxyacid dehydrogenase [Nisaea sediminum]|uniref:2-hydroxyacid dehydrogenase n=1 Tax=Nisaea sediminum TaxID=2775867 RepID=UPI0029C083BF|nr:2-hydroxyacid dehydrogenase [Nisaea sediminum]
MAEKPHVLIPAPYYKPAMDRLDEIATTHHLYSASDPKKMIADVAEKCVAFATFMKCEPSLMDQVPNAKLVANFGVGYDSIDIEEATARGVKVTNTPDVLNDCVADLALGLLISARRHIVHADSFVRAGEWPVKKVYGFVNKVHHSKVGIVGLGRIGEEIAQRCAGFKMEISYHNRSMKPDVPYRYYPDLVEMARDVEIMVVITPGGAATNNLVDEKVMEALGPKGLLVNVARGSVVDMDALIACLKDGRLGSAALDVFPDEPNVPEELFSMRENVVLTPHIASASHDTRMAMGMLVYDNLKAFFEGRELLTPVN